MKAGISGVLLALVVVFLASFWSRPVNVQGIRAPERWEYCRVQKSDAFDNGGYGARIDYFSANAQVGARTETIPPEARAEESGYSDDAAFVAVRRAVARLGSDGWEMVGIGPVSVWILNRQNAVGAFYFKRRAH